MGDNVYNDINACSEKARDSGTKTVIIYATAGDLNDDDTHSCNCFNPSDPDKKHMPYWMVREIGSKNSLHIAGCKLGGSGYPLPYPENQHTVINGHVVTRYNFKNTVSYYLRIKANDYGSWFHTTAASTRTVDTSTSYADWSDFIETICTIYKTEMGNINAGNVSFSMPDIDELRNPNDHVDHRTTGKAGGEAVYKLGQDLNASFRENMFVDYHIKDLPPNISMPDIQNKSAMTGVYCLALLDYNAWPEWGNDYQEWCNRSYFRTISSSDTVNVHSNLPLVFPNPANEMVNIQFDSQILSTVQIQIFNMTGVEVFHTSALPGPSNTVPISTVHLIPGTYVVNTQTGQSSPRTQSFVVVH